ncbi:AAA family ATPase [Paenibacillus aestuarii]|uniref:AAA family ATPase n=1 Tax=Paenibacillus aestuarii TaxID=516965 RepID=A0ABW0KE64_9BACL|nr:AAA family ATPase [Paenibacillus aestuarii]
MISHQMKDVSLRLYGQQLHQAGLPGFLAAAELVAEAVLSLHSEGNVHKRLSPDTIFVNHEGKPTAISFKKNTETVSEADPPRWAYRAPEQTGRLIHGIVDARADLYALGVIFFELLTGELPYQAEDPTGWMYAHIAKRPPHPCERVSAIPPIVGDMVVKLMAKSAAERYQSAYGLLYDLRLCRSSLEQHGRIETFTLGGKDFAGPLRMPADVSGREREKQLLSNAYAASLNGKTQLVAVSGEPGSGKTMLIREWCREQERGFCISGKADQAHSDSPYAPLIHAFQELIRRMLAGSEEQLLRWKDKLHAALGHNASFVAEMIPELSLIIGPLPPVEALPWMESRNRLQYAFQALLRAVAGKRTPLILFLDDIQWADAATLDLIASIAKGGDIGYSLLILAYRSQNLQIDQWLGEQAADAVSLERIELSAFTLTETEKFIGSILQMEHKQARPLAEAIYHKTAGNPFYIRQLLQTIFEQKLLWFETRAEEWLWDADGIHKLESVGDVREFLRNQLHKLPSAVVQALSLAACVGHTFAVQTLADVHRKSVEQVLADLEQALREGMILPVREADSRQSPKSTLNARFMFAHDTVQQVVYEAMTAAEQEAFHAAIGRVQWAHLADELDDNLYTVTHHLMLGRLHLSHAEKLHAAELALQASRKARKTAAYESASTFAAFATELLNDDDWRYHYELAHAVHLERMQIECLSGHVEQGELLFAQLLARSPDKLERLKVHSLKLEIDINLGKAGSAFEDGLQLLREEGIELLGRTSVSSRRKALLEASRMLSTEILQPPLRSPARTDAYELAVVHLLQILARASSFVDMDVFVVIICKCIGKLIEHDAVKAYPEIVAIFASFLSAECGWHKEGAELAEAACQMAGPSSSTVIPKLSFIRALVRLWLVSGRESLALFDESYRISIMNGDLYYAGFSLRGWMFSLYAAGRLDELLAFCQKHMEASQQHAPLFLKSFTLYRQFSQCLRGETDDPMSLNDGTFDEESFKQAMSPAEKRIGLYFEYQICKIQLLYVFGCYAEAFQLWQETEHSERYYKFHSHLSEGLFYGCLALCSDESARDGAEVEKQLKPMLTQMRHWAELNPAHFQHKYLLLKGEAARLKGKWEQAVSLYDEAIDTANEAGYVHMEALACERAGRLLLAQGKKRFAKTYLIDSYLAYQTWGAYQKCVQLRKQFPELLLPSFDASGSLGPGDARVNDAAREGQNEGETELPLEAERHMFKKAADRLTQAAGFEQLIGQYLQTLMENAGAAKGFWIVNKEGDWWIEAEQDINRNVTKNGHSATLESCFDLPISVIRFVARTKEPLILDDAHLDDLFAWDPYIRSVRPRSVICLPVQHLDRLAGIVYLENEGVTASHAGQRLELMQMMSAQLAVLNQFAGEAPVGPAAPKVAAAGKLKAEAGGTMLLQKLTEREKDVLRLMVKGLSNPEIAQRLELAVGTVKNITLVIYGKLQVNRRTQAVTKAKDWQVWE